MSSPQKDNSGPAGTASSAATYRRALALARSETKTDLAECLQLLQLASERGEPRATYALATWYLFGKVVEKNVKTGFKLLLRIRTARIREAKHDLAVCYEKGAGVQRNLRNAARYYREAALLGDIDSKVEIARCCYYGIGVKKDLEQVFTWYRAAARQGNTEAQQAVARAYEYGEGVRKSRRWSDCASAPGSDSIRRNGSGVRVRSLRTKRRTDW